MVVARPEPEDRQDQSLAMQNRLNPRRHRARQDRIRTDRKMNPMLLHRRDRSDDQGRITSQSADFGSGQFGEEHARFSVDFP
jgi:hypothetical protein